MRRPLDSCARRGTGRGAGDVAWLIRPLSVRTLTPLLWGSVGTEPTVYCQNS